MTEEIKPSTVLKLVLKNLYDISSVKIMSFCCNTKKSSSKTEVELNDGETGRFDISLTTVGAYGYTVKLIPDDRDLIFDQTVYRVKIYVDDAEGKLAVTYIVTKGDHKYDSKRLVFVNNAPKPDKPPHGPKTDDNSRTKTAFLFALIVAAGSLAISIYLTDRKKKNI